MNSRDMNQKIGFSHGPCPCEDGNANLAFFSGIASVMVDIGLCIPHMASWPIPSLSQRSSIDGFIEFITLSYLVEIGLSY